MTSSTRQIVLSASRRTDIPAFYMPWFMQQLGRGVFEVMNPFNRNVKRVPATPQTVHTIVFWSKNFGPFLSGDYGRQLQASGYHLFFNFTINAENRLLEPHVPPLAERLDQLKALCVAFGPECIHWRFDPICHYQDDQGRLKDNRQGFDRIAAQVAACGIRRCLTSFYDDYVKVRRRERALPGFGLVTPPLDVRAAILQEMAHSLEPYGIVLQTCCEQAVLAALPAGSQVYPASCIPNDRLVALYGPGIALRRDTGQRIRSGCGCKVSVDVGSYRDHPCYHNCLFCYANPRKPQSKAC